MSATFADIEALAEATAGSTTASTPTSPAAPCCGLALADGSLDAERWRSYQKLEAELAFERRKTDPREAAEHRRHWASIHKSVKQRMKSKYGD